MKKKLYPNKGLSLLLAAALLAGMVSCKKEKGPSELRAVMNDFATSGQKAYIDQEQYSCFVVGEKVRVNNSTGTITALERNDRQCVISGVAQTTNYNAFYPADMIPANSDLTNGFDNLTVSLPRVQVYETDDNGNQIIKNPMMAELTGANENKSTLHFRNLCALLKITVRTQKAFDKISVTMPGANLCGTGTISNDIITVDSNVGSTVTLALSAGHHGSPAGEAFYIMVPEVTVSACTVQILNGNTPVKTFTRTGSATFAANKIHTLGNFTFDAPVFTVNKISSKPIQVVFAPGNLQWSANAGGTSHSTATTGYNGGTWRFAEHQYDFIGAGNNRVLNTIPNGWIDLFEWGTSGYNPTYPYRIDYLPPTEIGEKGFSATNSNFKNYDWGAFNTIYNPRTKTNDPYGTWRTLTEGEWSYLLDSRGNWSYSNVKISLGSEYVYGLLVYPDNTTSNPLGSDNTTLKKHNGVTDKTTCEISETQYNALEAFGCVFLPLSGRIKVSDGNLVFDMGGTWGVYWCSTAYKYKNNNKKLYYLKVQENTAPAVTSDGVGFGYSVRLARDVK